jgi:hypothetical protein
MSKTVSCTCEWPDPIVEGTLTGHDPLCPVEKEALANRKVEFIKTIIMAQNDNPNLARVVEKLDG